MTENTSPKTPIDAVTEIMGTDAEYDAAEKAVEAEGTGTENVVTMGAKAVTPRRRAGRKATTKKTGDPRADRDISDAAKARDDSVLDGVSSPDASDGKAPKPSRTPKPQTAGDPRVATTKPSKAALKADGSRDLSTYRDKAPTATIVTFRDWLVQEVGITFPSKVAEQAFLDGVRLSGTLRHEFQASQRTAR